MGSFMLHLLYQEGIKPQYPPNRRVCEPKRQSGCFREEKNLLPLPGIKPQTVQPIAVTTLTILL